MGTGTSTREKKLNNPLMTKPRNLDEVISRKKKLRRTSYVLRRIKNVFFLPHYYQKATWASFLNPLFSGFHFILIIIFIIILCISSFYLHNAVFYSYSIISNLSHVLRGRGK